MSESTEIVNEIADKAPQFLSFDRYTVPTTIVLTLATYGAVTLAGKVGRGVHAFNKGRKCQAKPETSETPEKLVVNAA